MNWPMSFCIIGTSWAIVALISSMGNFKKYKMDEVAKSLVNYENRITRLERK